MGAVIKFIAAALWIVAVTLGAVFYSFQAAANLPAVDEKKPLLGGLDYVKTDVISVPLLKGERVEGYFLTRLVYTVEPKQVAKMSVPMDALLVDQVYSYLYGNPQIDFTQYDKLDLDGFRNGLRDSINARIGEKLVHEVMVEQIDFLTPDDVRDNAVRRRSAAATAAAKSAEAEAAGEAPAPAH
ncbi:hypothetical protein ACFFTN_23985 [Aminobacter aganoensis]|uniref:hypothetical protein n=1 Tax=Aminobacter TaxID=31988 RepID=UPI0009E78429|nr:MULTISPECIES: hypothetical protein [Aminobacter]